MLPDSEIAFMEEITEGVNNMNLAIDSQKKNRIQVSNTKKPLFFYVNLAKRYMQEHGDVELSALGMAIATIVTIAEIPKNNGFVVEKIMELDSFRLGLAPIVLYIPGFITDQEQTQLLNHWHYNQYHPSPVRRSVSLGLGATVQ